MSHPQIDTDRAGYKVSVGVSPTPAIDRTGIPVSYTHLFLFLKQNVGEDVFIAKEQPSATATVPAHKEDTSLSAPKMEPDSGRPSACLLYTSNLRKKFAEQHYPERIKRNSPPHLSLFHSLRLSL